MKISNKKIIEVSDWDALVSETYGKVYHFQQQDGCQDRGTIYLTVPSEDNDSEMYDSINGEEMGVKFAVWLARDPKQPIPGQEHDYELSLFWERNFYPDLQTVANDLHSKGLLEAGNYGIHIDW